MCRHIANAEDPQQRRIAAKIDRVQAIVRAYNEAPSDAKRDIRRVEDLFDDDAGLPR